ncbi:helix-turn-helix domain-containing protein [Archangium violaceum]|uniref:helix-turn-helix domain-containing protein n=1 Tax=Archangium violaceum TaxID=83451 RepID=UPI001EF07220|nr:helix-turn-helix domain-containing protein [Archangium violaceum]
MTNCNNNERMVAPMPDDSAWTVAEAATFLGIARSTLYRKAAEGAVPSFKVGGALRFSPAKLREWRDAQLHGAGV